MTHHNITCKGSGNLGSLNNIIARQYKARLAGHKDTTGGAKKKFLRRRTLKNMSPDQRRTRGMPIPYTKSRNSGETRGHTAVAESHSLCCRDVTVWEGEAVAHQDHELHTFLHALQTHSSRVRAAAVLSVSAVAVLSVSAVAVWS